MTDVLKIQVTPDETLNEGEESVLAAARDKLAEEVRGKGIDVECVNTYFVVRTLSPPLLSCLFCHRRESLLNPTGLQHVQNPPLKRAHPHAQGLRP